MKKTGVVFTFMEVNVFMVIFRLFYMFEKLHSPKTEGYLETTHFIFSYCSVNMLKTNHFCAKRAEKMPCLVFFEQISYFKQHLKTPNLKAFLINKSKEGFAKENSSITENSCFWPQNLIYRQWQTIPATMKVLEKAWHRYISSFLETSKSQAQWWRTNGIEFSPSKLWQHSEVDFEDRISAKSAWNLELNQPK